MLIILLRLLMLILIMLRLMILMMSSWLQKFGRERGEQTGKKDLPAQRQEK